MKRIVGHHKLSQRQVYSWDMVTFYVLGYDNKEYECNREDVLFL